MAKSSAAGTTPPTHENTGTSESTPFELQLAHNVQNYGMSPNGFTHPVDCLQWQEQKQQELAGNHKEPEKE